VDWHIQNDFHGEGVDGLGAGSYPRFTMEEWRKMARRLDQGRRINPRSMGPEWNHNGPRVRYLIDNRGIQTNMFYRDSHRSTIGFGRKLIGLAKTAARAYPYTKVPTIICVCTRSGLRT
jgi:hypothetical protein